MKQLVFNYVPVRFLPYREIGEFVNVGVVIHCPQTDLFDYRLIPSKRTGRVTGFFPELDATIFRAALQGITRELGGKKLRAQQRVPLDQDRLLTPEMARERVKWFRELVRRREGLLHFGEPGTLVAKTPEEALDNLFGRYIERQFAQPRQYQEVVMRNRLASLLRQWKLDHAYERNKEVGDAEFHVRMPFVHLVGKDVAKVIRPLDLNKAESSDIYQHGGTWVKNMERLKKRQNLPLSTVFTVELPQSGKRLNAAKEICSELQQIGVEPVEFSDMQALKTAVQVGTDADSAPDHP